MTFYPNIFNKYQKMVFPKLGFLAKEKFYLAGGTALALQLGHRTSLDFDFFVPHHFDSKNLIEKLQNIFEEDIKPTTVGKDTLFALINSVECSFFWYKYPLIRKPKKLQGVKLASIEDISAMKLISASHRPAQRDYIDIYYLIKKLGLSKMFFSAEKKYRNFNKYLILRALTYFEDLTGNGDKRPIKLFDKSFDWEKAKKYISSEVQKYQLGMIK